MAEKEMTANTVQSEKEKTPKYLILKDESGKAYKLEFNRKIVLQMQNNGFELDTNKLYKCARELIAGAFKMHHAWLDWSDIERIWVYQGGKRHELLGYLARMFSKPAMDLMGDGEDEDNGSENPTFEVVW